jgi:hypothetical protein
VRTFEVSDRERVKPSPRGGTTSLPAALREVKTSASGEIKISFGPNCSRFLRTSSSLGASHWLFSAPQRPDSENRSHLFHHVQTRRSRSIDNRRIKRSERTKEVDELGDSKGPYHQTDYNKYTNKSESTRRHERLLKIEFAASPGAIWNWGNLHSHLAGSAIQFRHSCSVESASVVCSVRSCIVTIPLRGFTKYRFKEHCTFPLNDITRNGDALKIYEYLAGGRPVVSTSVPAARRLASVVRIAETPEAISAGSVAVLHQPLVTFPVEPCGRDRG